MIAGMAALPANDDPLYKHVKGRIVEALRQGEWKPGELLPSESRLAELFSVGISTIRAAVGELANAGIIVRRQGKGTFVAVHDAQRIYRFFRIVRDGGSRQLPTPELISLSRGLADDQTADLLELPRSRRGHPVWRIRNLLRIEGSPVVVNDVQVPVDFLPGLTAKMLREGGRNLYATFQHHYGHTVLRIREELKAARADAIAAEHFGMKAGEPVLEVRRTAWSFDRRPFELRRSQIDTRSNHYRYEQGDDV
jgi:GntR family transcriptional regulator